MANAKQLLSKISAVMTKLNVTDRAVYKRVITRTGGDPLLGRGGTVSHTDTLLSPQPVVASANQAPLVGTTTALALAGEYVVTVLATSMTRVEVTDKNTVIVFKDSLGNEEELYIASFSPTVIQGTDITFDLILSSKKR